MERLEIHPEELKAATQLLGRYGKLSRELGKERGIKELVADLEELERLRRQPLPLQPVASGHDGGIEDLTLPPPPPGAIRRLPDGTYMGMGVRPLQPVRPASLREVKDLHEKGVILGHEVRQLLGLPALEPQRAARFDFGEHRLQRLGWALAWRFGLLLGLPLALLALFAGRWLLLGLASSFAAAAVLGLWRGWALGNHHRGSLTRLAAALGLVLASSQLPLQYVVATVMTAALLVLVDGLLAGWREE